MSSTTGVRPTYAAMLDGTGDTVAHVSGGPDGTRPTLPPMERSDKAVLAGFTVMALFALGMFGWALGGFEEGVGSDRRVRVPDLIGLKLSAASCKLVDEGLLAQQVGEFPPPKAFTPRCPRQGQRLTPDPVITSQIPQRGTRVVRGSVVLYETRKQ